MEEEEQGRLPFLDVLVERVSQQIHTSVFRKPTHTNSYIHYKSNHHPSTKIGTILWLKKRGDDLCKGQSPQRELEHIRTTFIANGYPEGIVRRILKKKRRRNDDLTKEGERVLCLPYIKGLSETLQRVCRPLKVRIRHKATNTLRSILTRIKIPLPETQKTGVIYEIPCKYGQVYIGETCKTLIDRTKEHKRSVQRIDTNNSLAVHVKETSQHLMGEC